VATLKVKITPEPHVYSTIEAAFPGKGKQKLDKYVQVLEKFIELSLRDGQSIYSHKTGLFNVATHQFVNQAGEIRIKGQPRMRLHRWLDIKKVALIENSVPGNSFSKKISQVKFIESNCKVQISDNLPDLRKMKRGELIKFLNQSPTMSDQQEVQNYLAQFKGRLTTEFDVSPINAPSLQNYIIKAVDGKLGLSSLKTEKLVTNQALWLLRVCQVRTNMGEPGDLPQLKKKSGFGRTYYEGLSVQSIQRTVRSAMLGDAWEYDIHSSVVSWRMSYLKGMFSNKKNHKDLLKLFPYTSRYLSSKPAFFKSIKQYVFDASSSIPDKKQTTIIKTAFTAMNFGAKFTQRTWKTKSGDLNEGSLRKIFKAVV